MHWDLLVPQGVIRIHTAFPTLLSGYERQYRHISERSSNMMMQTLEASASFSLRQVKPRSVCAASGHLT